MIGAAPRRAGRLAAVVAAALLAACASDPPSRSRRPPSVPVRPNVPVVPKPGPAPADEADRPPAAHEVPPDLDSIPDAVPEPVERSRYGNPDSYEVLGKRYHVLRDGSGFRERGQASWYGKKFHGRRTSSGEPYDMFKMTAAHKTLPLPSFVRVRNVANGKSVVVKVNDRGPFHRGRIIDLSYAAANRLGLLGSGSGEVEIEVVDAGGAPLPAPPQATVLARPEPEPAEPPPASALNGVPRYLQAGVFGDSDNAMVFRDHLRTSGVGPVVVKAVLRHEVWMYRVLIGPFDDPNALLALRHQLNADDTPTLLVHD